jgi:hypothetical protein
VKIEEVAIISASLIKDRNVLKVRINLKKNNRIFGFIKPIKYFE